MTPVKIILFSLGFMFLSSLSYQIFYIVMEDWELDPVAANSDEDLFQNQSPTVSRELKILTLNIWGIPIVSEDKQQRVEAIVNFLLKSNYDVVCLQEVWTDKDYHYISRRVQQKLPFSHYFYSGVFGSGICVLSKYSFEEVYFHQWPLNGYIHKLQHGDWFGGKGVGLCRLLINNYKVNIYSTHLHAEHDRKFKEYKTHRVLQAFDTAQFIRLTGSSADLVVLAGDLNTEPGDLAYRILIAATGLTDTFKAKIKESFMGTNEDYRNSYTNDELIRKKFPGKRIDYIMYRSSSKISTLLQEYDQPLPDRVPGKKYSYSDHEAVSASFQLSPIIRPKFDDGVNPIYKSVLVESIDVCDEALVNLSYTKKMYLLITLSLFLLFILTVDGHSSVSCMLYLFWIIIIGCMLYTLIMATLWNNIEYHAIIAGKLSMVVNLKQILASEYK